MEFWMWWVVGMTAIGIVLSMLNTLDKMIP